MSETARDIKMSQAQFENKLLSLGCHKYERGIFVLCPTRGTIITKRGRIRRIFTDIGPEILRLIADKIDQERVREVEG